MLTVDRLWARCLFINVATDNQMGISRIFIPADRYYPDGFTVTVGEEKMIFDPKKATGLAAIEGCESKINLSNYIWNLFRQQLVILKWSKNNTDSKIVIQPGIYQDILPRN
mgnify:CR=1 FL=1